MFPEFESLRLCVPVYGGLGGHSPALGIGGATACPGGANLMREEEKYLQTNKRFGANGHPRALGPVPGVGESMLVYEDRLHSLSVPPLLPPAATSTQMGRTTTQT